MRIVILGAPGSGKGTQAALVSERYGIPHIMPSELLHGEPVSGQAAHDNPLFEFATRRLRRKDAAGGFIIDGFPRTIQHAVLLDEVLTALKRPLHLALRITIDADAMIQRLAGRRRCRECGQQFNVFVSPMRLDEQCDDCGGPLHQRVDDTEDVIDNRLRVYESLSNPVATFYRASGLLHDIDGDAPVDEVATRIRAPLDSIVGKIRRAQAATRKAAPADKKSGKATAKGQAAAGTAPSSASGKAAASKKSAATKPAARKKSTVKPATKPKPAVRSSASKSS